LLHNKAHENLFEQSAGDGVPQSSPSSQSNLSHLHFCLENLEDGTHHCGAQKCLLPLKHDKRIGYLVANSFAPGLSLRMQQAYNMSLEIIEMQYGMEHVYIAAPHEEEIDNSFREWLWNNRTTGYNGQKQLARFPRNKVTVQAVEIIPSNESILFGCERPRLLDGVHQLVRLYTPENMKGIDLDSLAVKVSSQFSKLHQLMEDYPCLFDDFQIFLTRSGRLVHMDVDRCFSRSAIYRGETKEKPLCVPLLKYFESKVLEHIAHLSNFFKDNQRSTHSH